MDSEHFDTLARWLNGTQNRRSSLVKGLVALTALGFATNSAEIRARKKRKKKRKKKKPLSGCTKLCGVNCNKCLFRADAPPLCGDGIETSCLNCESDDDCVEEDRPFCITHFEDRVSGSITKSCGAGSLCGCDPDALGVCADVFVCGVVQAT